MIHIPHSMSPEPPGAPEWQEEETQARELLAALVARIEEIADEENGDPWLIGKLGVVLDNCKEYIG